MRAPNASHAAPRTPTEERAAAACEPASSSARSLQRATLVRSDDLALEALEEQLSAAARAQRLIRVVPDRGLAANGRVCSPKLRQRRTAGAGRDKDLTQSMPAEIAIKLSAYSHVDLQPGNHPKNGARGIPCSQYPETADLVPLIWAPLNRVRPQAFDKARPRAAKPRGADDGRRGRLALAG